MDINQVLLNQLAPAKAREIKAAENNGTDKNDRDSDIEKTAKEMEALFAYQLIKVMRETSNSFSEEEEGFGNNSYMSLFDMEISKLFAERGLGLRDALVKWMSRVEGQEISGNDNSNK